jgi:hypothetical protein
MHRRTLNEEKRHTVTRLVPRRFGPLAIRASRHFQPFFLRGGPPRVVHHSLPLACSCLMQIRGVGMAERKGLKNVGEGDDGNTPPEGGCWACFLMMDRFARLDFGQIVEKKQ